MTDEPDWAERVLEFWFGEMTSEDWFASNTDVDADIRDRFLATWEGQRSEPPAAFLPDADTALAATILFDQFPRNMFRGDGRAFESDPLARAIASGAIDKGFDTELDESRRQFLYMPFMHSEDMADQDRCVALFETFSGEGSLGYAVAHRKVIDRFGRFPHRNEALGRETTAEEKEAIANGAVW